MKRLWRLAMLTAALGMWAAPPLDAGALTSEVDGLRVELTSSPSRPATNGQTEYVVRLVDRAGQPVTGARLVLRGAMADGMSVVAPLRPAGEAGVNRGRVLFTMEGRWELTLGVVHKGTRLDLSLTEQVGR